MDGACGVGGCRYPLSSLGGGDRLPAGRAFLRRLTSKRGLEYTHYSLLVFGFNRIPIVAWLREQATELLTHAQQAGEMITHLGDYPSLTIGPLLDTRRTDVGTILRESPSSRRGRSRFTGSC